MKGCIKNDEIFHKSKRICKYMEWQINDRRKYIPMMR